MLRDTRVGLIEPMLAARELMRSRSDMKEDEHRTIDPHALKIPGPEGAESTRVGTLIFHFLLNRSC